MGRAEEYKEALRQLDKMHAEGKIDTARYEKKRAALLAESPALKAAEAWAEKRRIVDEDLAAGRIGKTEHAAKMRDLAQKEAADAKAGRTVAIGCLAVLVLAVLMTIGVVSCINNVSNKPPSESSKEADAIYACRQSVKEKLKSPSSATFSRELAQRVEGNPNKFRVTGQVEADNSFGAKIRAAYACDATWISKDTTSASAVIIE